MTPVRKSAHGVGALGLAVALVMWTASSASAYPEFQRYSQKVSGRYVNCAMCHVNPDGPIGMKPGQIGSLTPKQLKQLNKARAAFEPGQNVTSPILNAFGNSILRKLGKKKILELRLHPEQLAGAYGYESDLDGDGIPDAREFLDGTDPVDAQSGSPWLLFKHNVWKNLFPALSLLAAATLLGLYGLNNLLRWFHHIMELNETNSSGTASKPSS